MGMIAWIVPGLMLAGAVGLLVSLLAGGPLSPARRHLDSDRGYGSRTPVLARAEKRLCQDQDWRPLGGQRRGYQDKPPL